MAAHCGTTKNTLANTRQAIRRIEASRDQPKKKIIAEIETWRFGARTGRTPGEWMISESGIISVLTQLRNHTVEEALVKLRETERRLATSKPALD